MLTALLWTVLFAIICGLLYAGFILWVAWKLEIKPSDFYGDQILDDEGEI